MLLLLLMLVLLSLFLFAVLSAAAAASAIAAAIAADAACELFVFALCMKLPSIKFVFWGFVWGAAACMHALTLYPCMRACMH